MSAVPESLPAGVLVDAPPPARGAPVGRNVLPRKARVYLAFLALLTVASAGTFYLRAPEIRNGWATFVVLAAAASVAQIFPVKSPRNAMYHTSVVFLVAAALLLPPELIVLIPLVQTVPEWLKERTPWPIQGFNVSNYTLNSLAAWGAARLIEQYGSGVIHNPETRFAAAGLAAAVAFVAVNHLLVAVLPKLGRGPSFRESRLFGAGGPSVSPVL